jgi:hypothetical protein
MNAIERGTLELFLEKSHKLLSSTVRTALEEGRVRFGMRASVGKPVETEVEGPPAESVEAFILTLRFFVQNNESISIQRTALLIEGLRVSEELKTRVRDGRTAFNAFLDTGCPIQIDGQCPTNREVFEVFVYGTLAHANPPKKQVYDSWSRNPIVIGMMNAVFMSTLTQYLVFIGFLKANVEAAIEELTRSGHW